MPTTPPKGRGLRQVAQVWPWLGANPGLDPDVTQVVNPARTAPARAALMRPARGRISRKGRSQGRADSRTPPEKRWWRPRGAAEHRFWRWRAGTRTAPHRSHHSLVTALIDSPEITGNSNNRQYISNNL